MYDAEELRRVVFTALVIASSLERSMLSLR